MEQRTANRSNVTVDAKRDLCDQDKVTVSRPLRDLALFNSTIDSKLRACDLVSLRVKDVAQGQSIFHRAIVMQQKTRKPVQFEITKQNHQ